MNPIFLMQKRFIVTSKWPDSKNNIGNIITLPSDDWRYGDEKETYCKEDFFKDYPNCFRQLHWAEFRSISEMMEIDYLMIVDYVGYWVVGDVVKVEDYKIETKKKQFYSFVVGGDIRYTPDKVEPATKEDYEHWKRRNKN